MMTDNQYDIFISYRREGGKDYARTIQQALEKQYKVFLDFDELKDGVFDQRIMDAISHSSVFILLLTKGALDRCVNEDDWVRAEIIHAGNCKCHIVPVIIDDTFEGIPEYLPTELKDLVGSHQFSELQTKTLFRASIRQLINDRIAPYIHKSDLEVGAEVHIEADANCQLYHFKKKLAHIQTGEDHVIHLKRGKHKLEFVSTEYNDIKVMKILDIPDENYTDFVEIELSTLIENRHKAEADANHKVESRELIVIEQKGLYGFKDKKTDEVVIPCQWNDAWPFHEELAVVKDNDGKFGFIDKKGKVVIPCKWKMVRSGYENGLALVQHNNGKFGFIDKKGNVVIPCKYISLLPFKDGLALAADESEKIGFIDTMGQTVVPFIWQSIGSLFEEGLAAVQDGNGKWGFINKSGLVVIPCIWEKAYGFSEGLAKVLDANGVWHYIDKMGKIVKTLKPIGAEIHIKTDADCRLYYLNKLLMTIHAGKDSVIYLKRGKHELEFVSMKFTDVKVRQIIDIPEENYKDFVEIKLEALFKKAIVDKIKIKMYNEWLDKISKKSE